MTTLSDLEDYGLKESNVQKSTAVPIFFGHF